eukprot:gene19565-38970_t
MMLALALGNLTLCAALFFFESANGKPPALATWNIGKQCQAVGWLLLTLTSSGLVPEPVAVVVGYPVLFTGVALEAGALWELAGRSGWRRITYALLALAVASWLMPLDTGFALMAIGVAEVLLLGGLLASFFHLGQKARAWRAAAMWRTSWMSREVIV